MNDCSNYANNFMDSVSDAAYEMAHAADRTMALSKAIIAGRFDFQVTISGLPDCQDFVVRDPNLKRIIASTLHTEAVCELERRRKEIMEWLHGVYTRVQS